MLLTSRRSNPRHKVLASLGAAALLPAALAAPTAVPAPAASQPLLVPYTVTSHDTLTGLKRTLFTSPGAWKEVARINHLSDSNRIRPGQVLMVPGDYLHAKVGAVAGQSADVPANFGAPLQAGRKPVVLPLPPAPDLSTVPELFDQLPIRVHLPGNWPLRVQVADDAAFDHIALDLHVAAGDDIRIPQLADGDWHLRARRISPEGLQGLDAVRDFRLRARPESPFLLDPPANAKRPVGDVTLRWTHNPDAVRYVLEVARDAQFTQIALADDQVRGEQGGFHPVDTDYGAADGVYWWHVVSVDAGGRRGAWSDTQALVLRPTPRAPLGRLSPDGAAIELAWGGRPEDRVEVELAADPDYRQIVARGDFGAPNGRLGRPATGTYWARYRFVEPDGFSTAWSGSARIEVDSNWHQALRALLP